MKKRIAIYMSIIIVLFLAGSAYTFTSIEKATSKLGFLVKLHQVEILREHLLIQIHKVQTDFLLMDSRFARTHEAVAANISNLQTVSTTCTECHHRPAVQERIDRLINEIDGVRENLQTLLTSQAASRRSMMREMAYQMLEHVEIQVNGMIHMATAKLSSETDKALANITRCKTILYGLAAVAPLVVCGIMFYFMREFTRPVQTLLTATRRLKGGDLDHRIEGLNQEFGEVATSFNQMSEALKLKIYQLAESEKRYRMLFESAGDAIFIMEAEGEQRGRIIATNQAAADMHGYTVEEMQQMNIGDVDSPEEAKHVPERVRRILAGEWITAEITHRRKDGTVFPMEISAGLMELEGHKYILAFDRDITERREMEDKLRQSEQEWIDTFNTITDMVTLHDKDFNIIKANAAARRMLDIPDMERVKFKCFNRYHGKDDPPDNCASCQCIKNGRPSIFEVYEPHLGKLLEIRAIPRFDDQGQITGVLHVSRDITERKQIEDNLQRAEQMKLVGEWATALAHEIKNPLAGIKVAVEVLAEELDTEEDRTVVKRAVHQIKRIEMLLKSLLNFAKPPKPQPAVTDLNALLARTMAFAVKKPAHRDGSQGRIKISRNFDADLPWISIDPIQFQQIFLNLILNATEAMPGGGQLQVTTRHDISKNKIAVEIADTGTGIEQDDLERIFQPFFTTKKKGTGLGLAITKRLIEQHSGKISVSSAPGQGTTFCIELPGGKSEEETKHEERS
ncbi:MAG: PAS domain S-box protein [Desulfobacteraceae bacterium]